MEAERNIIGTILEEPVEIGEAFEVVLPEFEDQETLLEGKFTWALTDWYALTEPKYYSPRVQIGDFQWDVLLFPFGNHNKGIAFYLAPHPSDVTDGEGDQSRPPNPDWHCCAQFAIAISRPKDDAHTFYSNKSHHRFNSGDTDWGFANYIDLNALKYPSKVAPKSYLNEGCLNVTVYVRILKDPTGVLWHNFMNYDSKKVTGYVGFKNQGATCYLNSLLQSYFFTKYFRRLVYEIPTDMDSPNNSVPLALQRAFYQLQVSNEPLDTLELTRSFGWDNGDAFTQHDVQELNRILMDRLENRMKETPVEGKLNELFVGKMKSYIKCINVDYESSRVEDFWDLQLNVKNLKGLEESFSNYIEIELMNGENQYAAQDYGLQDAEKGVIFESFPPVLHLQLKRFEYDFNYDQLIKINDRYEFPETIDVSPYIEKGSEQLSNKEACIYNLHGVLVHAGDISTGHYYTMIRPGVSDEWYRFDDDKVWRVTKKQAFDENFGLDRLIDDQIRNMTREQYQDYILARHTSAYMLVYLRKDKEQELLQPVSDADVPAHILERVGKEIEEKQQHEKEGREAHLYCTIRVHTIKNFIHYEGLDTFPNENFKFSYEDRNDGREQPLTIKVEKSINVNDLCDDIKNELGIPVDRDVRFWKMASRQNNTIRVAEPLASPDKNIRLEETLEQNVEESFSYFDLFVEEPYLELEFLNQLKKTTKSLKFDDKLDDELIDELRRNLLEYVGIDDIPKIQEPSTHNLIFIKGFDVDKQKLLGLGHKIITPLQTIDELKVILSELLGLSDTIQFREEINMGNSLDIPDGCQFCTAEISTGDIVSFEIPGSSNVPDDVFPFHPTIGEFYTYLEHRIKLRFSKAAYSGEEYVAKDSPSKTFEIWVCAYIAYADLARIVGQFIEVDAAYLKLFALYSNGRYALKSNSILNEFLIKDFNCYMIPPFEYEVLSIPLVEFEHLRPIKFYWLSNSYIHFQCFEFEIPVMCSVDQFLKKLQAKLSLSNEDKDNVLLWTNNNFKFQSVLEPDTAFKQIPKSSLIFGRILPAELAIHQQITGANRTDSDNDRDGLASPDQDASLSSGSLQSNQVGKLVVVTQFFKDLENRHGISFLFNLVPGEHFPETKERLHNKFGLGQKEFAKIKLSVILVSGHRTSVKPLTGAYTPEELKRIVLYDKMNNWDGILMDHPDRLRSHAGGDRPMFIKN